MIILYKVVRHLSTYSLEHVPVDHMGIRSTYKKVLFQFVIVRIKYAIYTNTRGPINISVGDMTPFNGAIRGQVALPRMCWQPTALTWPSQLDRILKRY